MSTSAIFDDKLTDFLSKVTAEDKALLANCGDLDAFLSHLKDLDSQHHGASHSRRAVEFCGPVIVAFRRFGRALDVFCQIKPEILASLWGGLRIVIHMAGSFREFFDSIMSSLETIGNNISRVTMYENLFPNTDGVKKCLGELYSELLQFFLHTKKLYKDALSGKKRIILPRRLNIFLKAMLSAFHEDADTSERAIQEILDRLDKEAAAASFEYVKAIKGSQTKELKDAKTHRDKVEAEIDSQTTERQSQATERQEQATERQDQNAERKEQAAERRDQETERQEQTLERQLQATERKKQSDWRALEEKYWLDQNIVSQTLVTSFSEEAQKSLIAWLSPISSEDRHDEALKSQYPGTCMWIFDTPEFIDWTGRGNWMLWVHGISGAGKTVLAASTIKRLQDDICPDEAVAYFYFDHRHADSQTTRDFLATIIVSLIGRSPAFLEEISKDLESARLAGRSPTANLLEQCLANSIQHFEGIYIVVDALDESSTPDQLLEQLNGLRDPLQNKVRLLVTSRTNAHIQESFEEHEPNCLKIKLKPSLTHADIVKYAEGQVNDMVRRRKLKLRDALLQADIISTLSDKSDGMFQWVKCQLDQLRTRKNDRAIRKALETLPRDLNETYVQALHQLVKHHELDEVVQIERLLRWLVHAARPLNIDEMAEVIAVDFGQHAFDLSAVVTDPMDLLKYGESLITLSGENSRYLQLSHFSVKEFLESEYCLVKVPRFYMQKVRSNAQIAHVCLTALSFEEHAIGDDDDNNDMAALVKCPLLYEYSISHWVDHYHVAHSSDTRPEALAISLLVSKPVSRNFAFMRKYLGKRSSYLPIHYCAQYGLVYFLQDILNSGEGIDVESEPYGTPLNFAARHDRAVVNEFLLDRGANVNKVWSSPNQRGANNCLHWALDEDRVSLVSERLVRYIAETPGIDINLMGGVTSLQRPLHYPARANRPEILDILLSCGAAIDGLDGDGRTPLHVALEERALESVHFLLEQGASMTRADKCDSMREGGFGFSTSILPTAMDEARWEVAALLRNYRPSKASLSHWGIQLGQAVQHGQLETVKKILDTELQTKVSKRANSNDNMTFEMNAAELESKLGTLFATLDTAMNERHWHVASELLERMALLFEHQQKKSSTTTALDVHAVLIHDRPDIPFCKSAWSDSALYISIILGYIRLALALLQRPESMNILSVVSEPFAVPFLSKEIQLIIYLGQHGWTQSPEQTSENRESQSEASSALERAMTATQDQVHRLCEKARMLWKFKRNRKDAFNMFFTGEAVIEEPMDRNAAAPVNAQTHDILIYLYNLGADINSLDRAGCTPLYWAHVRSWHEARSTLESRGGKLFGPPVRSLAEIRTSILSFLHDLDSPENAEKLTALDLSRKWDWDDLGRYLYHSGDEDNAVRAFEAGAVYDPTGPADVKAVHYFNCDSCYGEYSYENLLRGMRFVPLGLVNIDLCSSCAEVLGSARLGVPSPDWIQDRQGAHEEQEKRFKEIDEAGGEVGVRDKAKADWKRERALKLKEKIQLWLRNLTEQWEKEDQEEHLKRYVAMRERFVKWLKSEEGEKGLMAMSKLERW